MNIHLIVFKLQETCSKGSVKTMDNETMDEPLVVTGYKTTNVKPTLNLNHMKVYTHTNSKKKHSLKMKINLSLHDMVI